MMPPFLQYITSSRMAFENTHGAVASPKGRQLVLIIALPLKPSVGSGARVQLHMIIPGGKIKRDCEVPLLGQVSHVLQPLELELLLHQAFIHVSHVYDEPEFSLRALSDDPHSKELTTSGLFPLGRIEMALATSIFFDRGGHEALMGQGRRSFLSDLWGWYPIDPFKLTPLFYPSKNP